MGRPWVRNTILILFFGAAAAAGYLVSARVGAEALRREAQVQLGRLMLGEVRIGRASLVIRGGLYLEGDRVGVYPREKVPRRPKLFASHVSAELDIFALIAGRFGLASLTVDDLVFEIERGPDGRYSPTPVELLQERRLERMPDGMERNLDLANALEAVTRTLLERPIVARTVEVRRGRVRYVDHLTRGADGDPRILSLHHVSGQLVHHWPSDEADLELDALLEAMPGQTIPIHAEGQRRRGEAMSLSISSDGFDLSIFDPYLASAGRENTLAGTSSGELRFETRALGHGQISLQCTLENFATTIDVRRGHFVIRRPWMQLESRMEIHPGRVRLESARLDAQGIELELEATIERPLRLSSRMRVRTEVGGLDLEEVREIARSLPGQDGVTLEKLLEGVEDGRIDRIGGGGIAPIADWRALVLGELIRLPPGFVLSADLANIQVSTGEGEYLEGLAGHVEMSGDRLAFSDANAAFRGQPLPTLNLVLEGVSNLFRAGAQGGRVTLSPGRLPGVAPLWEILKNDEKTAQDEEPPIYLVRIDRLEHPIFRWPIRDARMKILPNESGADVTIEGARWSSARVSGEAVWLAGANQAVAIRLRLSPLEASDAELAANLEGAAAAAGQDLDPEVGVGAGAASAAEVEGEPLVAWASGRFEVSTIKNAPLPLRALRGEFALRGSALDLSQVRADLDPEGKLVATASLGLADPEEVALGLKLTIAGAQVNDLGRAMGLPDGFATGRLHLSGRLDGSLRPQTPILADLQGDFALDVRDGEIRRDELPLVLAIAQASAGYNRFAERSAVAFEAVTATVSADRGRVSSGDFRVEGPLRVYGSGWVDVVNPPYAVEGLVGVFLFRGAGQLMETVPLVKAILPGSERGLVGAYYTIEGSFSEPSIEPMTGKSIAEDLPDVLAAPFRVLQALLGGRRDDEGSSDSR